MLADVALDIVMIMAHSVVERRILKSVSHISVAAVF